MAQAASRGNVLPRQLSFKGALDLLNAFAENLVQFHRSLFAMHCPCNNGDYETPNVCWSAVEHATTASGERPSLTQRLRVTTLPDPACQREQPTSLPNRGAPRMYGTNRAQRDSCVPS